MTNQDSSVSSELAPPPPPARWHNDDKPSAAATVAPCVRLMCSFGGRILPRPHDNQLRYVGGDTRIVAINRSVTTFSSLQSKLSKFTPTPDFTIKYQLPNEDLDALISVTSDEDVENMMEEYDRLLAHTNTGTNSRMPRLRLFLFPPDGGGGFVEARALSTSSSKHEHWFVNALNGRGLERGRSEASSIMSEVPDYLFGLDNNSDEPLAKPKTSVSVSDPGSPAPVMSSPKYGSSSSVASVPQMPDLPSVRIKPETMDNQTGSEVNHQGGYVQNPVWQYVEPVPVYYVPGPAPGGPLPARPVQPIQMPMQYVQRVQPVGATGQIPVGYRPVYIGAPPAGRPPMVGSYDYPTGPTAAATEAYNAPVASGSVPLPMYHHVATTGGPPVESPADTRIVRTSN